MDLKRVLTGPETRVELVVGLGMGWEWRCCWQVIQQWSQYNLHLGDFNSFIIIKH